MGESKTVLLSTHILQEVDAMADRVLFINEGKLLFDDTVAAFAGNGEALDVRFRELTGNSV